jgi:hypothetical protein
MCASLVLVAGLFTSLVAHVDGPPTATTGGFGEETCRMCHFDYELNDPAGSLRLEGLPGSYVPGEAYLLTLRLSHPALERGGFELAARFAAGESAGQQAGSFEAVGNDVEIVPGTSGAVQFARQTRAGTSPRSKGVIAWSLRWQAPTDARGPITFNVAANAANFDDSPLGDFPYATAVTVNP